MEIRAPRKSNAGSKIVPIGFIGVGILRETSELRDLPGQCSWLEQVSHARNAPHSRVTSGGVVVISDSKRELQLIAQTGVDCQVLFDPPRILRIETRRPLTHSLREIAKVRVVSRCLA